MYCHKISSFIKAKIKPRFVPKNLHIIASCDTEDQIKEAKKHGYKYARVVKEWDTVRKNEVRCRYQLDGTNCSNCRLCFSNDKRIRGIIFKQH